MSIVTLEGIVEHGQIRLEDNLPIPDKTQVYVIVPEIKADKIPHVYSPRSAHSEQSNDFRMEIVVESSDARL